MAKREAAPGAIYYRNEDEARIALERIRWPSGPICPKCGTTTPPYKGATKPSVRRATGKLPTRVTPARQGLYCCRDCCRQFTVTVGTIFEDSRIPLSKWLAAFHLIAAS